MTALRVWFQRVAADSFVWISITWEKFAFIAAISRRWGTGRPRVDSQNMDKFGSPK